ncbi:uncharacterized protein N7482_006427 [Penicillium canariense]|uniref:Uncharacterized protein n=1 Tax=Penicillium canariense TaxID=189055 RepID=A0A9W9LJD5_9EURO|nr:uncharacterized protein N7482_006427 [Penicillium canariense]KAJ5159423.1 hypothetical protein N7482_006427 [Penicillium canariense]
MASSPGQPFPVSPWHGATYDTLSDQETELPLTNTFAETNYPRRQSSPNFQLSDAPLNPRLPLLLLNDADTLVYIDPAPEDRTRNNILTPSIPHRVRSEKILATGSIYFERLFKPRHQTRVRKHRGLATRLPPGIKYVIDLTPPTLDEDAIIFLTEVSCPMGIRTWALSRVKWRLPPSCIGGEDEMDVLPFTPESPTAPGQMATPVGEDDIFNLETPGVEDEGTSMAEGENQPARPQQPLRTSLPLEYSAVRHREGIEKILHVLEGLNATLDTPSKLWTFFAIAKLLDVAKVPAVSGYIISWFYHSSNIRFIEIHPEIAYRVACGIKASNLCRDSFVGLVGDEALLYLMRDARLAPLASWVPTFDRSRIADFLDDTEVQRIEYASKSFVDEIIGHFLQLAGTDMLWMTEIDEFGKLAQHLRDFPCDEDMVYQIVTMLKDYVRSRIYQVLLAARDPRRSWDVAPPNAEETDSHIFHRSSVLQRVIGRYFWLDLLKLDLSMVTYRRQEPHSSIAQIGNGMNAFQGQDKAWIGHLPKIEVEQKVREFNLSLLSRAANPPVNPKGYSAQATNENHLRKFTVNLARPFKATRPSVSDGYDKPLTVNLRHAHPSPPNTEGSTSASTDRHLTVNQRLPQPDEDFSSGDSNMNERTFDLTLFLTSVGTHVSRLSRKLLYPYGIPVSQLLATDTLCCLTDNQFRFLPLWAGGNDDGTGGVFTDHDIPVVETGGFSAPGPSVHTGSVSSTYTDSSFSEIDPSDSRSTIHGASHHATYSHASDLISVDSLEKLSRDNCKAPTQSHSIPPFLPSAVSADEGDFDIQSNGGSTVVMGSPQLSDIDDDDIDIDMEHPDVEHPNIKNDDSDNDFELVDLPRF